MGKKFYAMMAVLAFAAGGMDVNAVYTLDGIEVSADRQKDRFGNIFPACRYRHPEAIGAANTDIPRHIPLFPLMEMPELLYWLTAAGWIIAWEILCLTMLPALNL